MNFLNKILGFIKISRPLNCLITFITIVIAALVCTSGNFILLNVISAALAGAFTAAGGNAINDIYDLEIDKINSPQRPLPAKIISVKEAAIFYISINLLAIFLSFFAGIASALIVSGTQIILFLYSVRLKHIAFWGNIAVALLTGMTFFYGGIIVSNWKFSLIPAGFAFIINLIREIIKDMEDINGDSKLGVITFPQKFGFRAAKSIIIILILIFIAAIFSLYFVRIYKIEFFIIILITVIPVLLYIIKSLLKDDSVNNLKKISLILKINMIFGLAAIYFAK